MNTRLRDEISVCGGPSVVASSIGITAQRLCNWVERGVPVEHAAALEKALGGRVKRWHMRPDDWHLIWPELVDPPRTPKVSTKESKVA